MRIITRAVYRMDPDGGLTKLAEEGFTYRGPIARCGGGPSATAQAAEKAQANLANTSATNSADALAFQKAQMALVQPYAQGLMQKGASWMPALQDFNSAQNAAAWAPAQSALNRRLSSFSSLPGGYANQAQTDLAAARSHSFDQNLFYGLQQNEASKFGGAQLLTNQAQLVNPQGWTGQAVAGNNSAINAPTAPGLASVLGGVAGAGLGALGNIYCWCAAAVFNEDFYTGRKTSLVRDWLWTEFSKHWYAAPILGAYRRWGKWASQRPILVRALTPIFQLALRRAGGGR
jgi:hypothetical protein